MTTENRAPGSYVYDQAWADERARLAALATIYDPGSFRLLDRLGVGEGWSCLEVGAGEGSVTRWLAERVGAKGRVLAVDLDPRFLEASDVVEVRQQDILTGPPAEAEFDLVYARAVVEWVADRPRAIANLVAALRPGGVLLLEDVDVEASGYGYPPSENRLIAVRAILALTAAGGADLTFGRELRARMDQAGLADIGHEVRAVVQRGGEPTLDFQRLTLKQLGPVIVERGLMSEEQLAVTEREFADPQAYGYPPLMVAVWGRRAR